MKARCTNSIYCDTRAIEESALIPVRQISKYGSNSDVSAFTTEAIEARPTQILIPMVVTKISS